MRVFRNPIDVADCSPTPTFITWSPGMDTPLPDEVHIRICSGYYDDVIRFLTNTSHPVSLSGFRAVVDVNVIIRTTLDVQLNKLQGNVLEMERKYGTENTTLGYG